MDLLRLYNPYVIPPQLLPVASATVLNTATSLPVYEFIQAINFSTPVTSHESTSARTKVEDDEWMKDFMLSEHDLDDLASSKKRKGTGSCKCRMCGKQYVSTDGVRKHWKKMHGEPPSKGKVDELCVFVN